MEVQEFLAHHGIKGQKWGIRRFQEEDGTLTAAGRARYDVDIEKSKKFYKEAKEQVKQHARSNDYYLNPEKTTRIQAKKDFAKEQYKNEKTKARMNERKNAPGKHETNLIEKYKKEGMSQEEAEVRAYRRVRAEKIGAVAAAVTITAAASYVAYKHWDATGDRFIKAGKTVQNLSTDGQKDVHNAFYGTFTKQDKSKYVGLFGGRHLQGKGDVYAMNAKVGEGGLKVAGDKNAQKVLAGLLKNDSSFRSDVEGRMNNLVNGKESFGWTAGEKAKAFKEHLSKGKLTKEDYRFFNTMLVDHTQNQQKITDQFYQELKKRGYGAVMDVNDKWQSGYNAKSPIIVFNGAEKFINKSTSKLDPAVMQKGRVFWEKKLARQVMRKTLVKEALIKNPTVMIYGTAAPAIAVGGIKANKKNSEDTHKKMIRRYKKEHPNTTLSNTEILRNVYGYT